MPYRVGRTRYDGSAGRWHPESLPVAPLHSVLSWRAQWNPAFGVLVRWRGYLAPRRLPVRPEGCRWRYNRRPGGIDSGRHRAYRTGRGYAPGRIPRPDRPAGNLFLP